MAASEAAAALPAPEAGELQTLVLEPDLLVEIERRGLAFFDLGQRAGCLRQRGARKKLRLAERKPSPGGRRDGNCGARSTRWCFGGSLQSPFVRRAFSRLTRRTLRPDRRHGAARSSPLRVRVMRRDTTRLPSGLRCPGPRYTLGPPSHRGLRIRDRSTRRGRQLPDRECRMVRARERRCGDERRSADWFDRCARCGPSRANPTGPAGHQRANRALAFGRAPRSRRPCRVLATRVWLESSKPALRPFRALFGPSDFAGLDFPGPLVQSSEGYPHRLDELTCGGCHQTRSIAGFHLLGSERERAPAGAALATPISPHLSAELDRRRKILRAWSDGRKLRRLDLR